MEFNTSVKTSKNKPLGSWIFIEFSKTSLLLEKAFLWKHPSYIQKFIPIRTQPAKDKIVQL